MIAIENDVMDCVDALVDAGANLDLYNEKNHTSPLEMAFKMRSLRMVKALVNHGVDVRKSNPNVIRAMRDLDFKEGSDYIQSLHVLGPEVSRKLLRILEKIRERTEAPDMNDRLAIRFETTSVQFEVG